MIHRWQLNSCMIPISGHCHFHPQELSYYGCCSEFLVLLISKLTQMFLLSFFVLVSAMWSTAVSNCIPLPLQQACIRVDDVSSTQQLNRISRRFPSTLQIRSHVCLARGFLDDLSWTRPPCQRPKSQLTQELVAARTVGPFMLSFLFTILVGAQCA